MPSFKIIGLLVALLIRLRPSGSGEEDFLKVFAIYSHGGHLGHATLTVYTVYIKFCSSIPRILHIKFGFDWSSCYQEN